MRCLLFVALVAPAAGFGYFPAEYTQHTDIGYCGRAMNEVADATWTTYYNSIDECYQTCVVAFPDSTIVSADFWPEYYDGRGCWCQDSCACVWPLETWPEGGSTSITTLPIGMEVPADCIHPTPTPTQTMTPTQTKTPTALPTTAWPNPAPTPLP